MTNSRDNLAVLKLAKKKGINPTKIGKVRFANLALEAQGGVGAKARAAARAVGSRVRTGILQQFVPAAKSSANEAACMACPHGALERLKDGTPACVACGCQGKFIKSKWMDPNEYCPLTVSGKRVVDVGILASDPPVWTNVEVPNAGT